MRLGIRVAYVLAAASLAASVSAAVPGENGRIAFDAVVDGTSRIAVIDAGGAGYRGVAPDAVSPTGPAWSPDGSKIAFSAGEPDGDLWVLDFYTGALTRLTDTPAVSERNPAWSPDGARLAFDAVADGSAARELFTVNADGTGLAPVAADPADDAEPAWSPDGTTIAFASNRTGHYEIWGVTLATSALVKLSASADDAFVPDFSPDGLAIVYASRPAGLASSIWKMGNDGSSPLQLGTGDMPAFSPDGAKIAFVAGDGAGLGLWTMNADGTGAAPLLSREGDESAPSWQPLNPGANVPPTANAGPDATVECSSFDGGVAHLDGSASTDPDSTSGTNDDIVLYEWWEGFGTPGETFLGTGAVNDLTLPLGEHVLTLQVTDRFGQTSRDSVVVTIVDTTPPEISVSLTPHTIWPPNHRMVPVHARVEAHDVCGPVEVVLTSVTSNEPDNGPGDGNFPNDIQRADVGTPDFDFQVRAERAGGGHGRVYTAVYTATDLSGNSAGASDVVVVPHDRGNGGGNGNGNGNGNGGGNGKGHGKGHGRGNGNR